MFVQAMCYAAGHAKGQKRPPDQAAHMVDYNGMTEIMKTLKERDEGSDTRSGCVRPEVGDPEDDVLKR